jgi:membrane protein YdbS with pleckstrin-like domain
MNTKPIATFRRSLWHWSNLFKPITDKLEVYPERVVWRSGQLGTSHKIIPINQITDVTTAPGCIGAILGYGLVEIQTAGSPRPEIRVVGLANPRGLNGSFLSRLQLTRVGRGAQLLHSVVSGSGKPIGLSS